jgi:LytS/YehU family sensor histidine kinase
MGFKKGEVTNPKGRPKGKPNKTTAEIREAYQKLVEDNLTNMTEWLTQVAAENPEKAMELMLKLSEYMIPKLARQEVTGADGADLFKNIKFEFGTPINERDE